MSNERVPPGVNIRVATLNDKNEIAWVMKRSMEVLGLGHYTEQQVQSSLRFVCVPDEQIIADGTYYVVENEQGVMLACGGWSFRNTLYAGPKIELQEEDRLDPQNGKARIRAMFVLPNISSKGLGTLILNTSENAARTYGFRRGVLGATESGLAFYKARGWSVIKEDIAALPDGVKLKITLMEKVFKTVTDCLPVGF